MQVCCLVNLNSEAGICFQDFPVNNHLTDIIDITLLDTYGYKVVQIFQMKDEKEMLQTVAILEEIVEDSKNENRS